MTEASFSTARSRIPSSFIIILLFISLPPSFYPIIHFFHTYPLHEYNPLILFITTSSLAYISFSHLSTLSILLSLKLILLLLLHLISTKDFPYHPLVYSIISLSLIYSLIFLMSYFSILPSFDSILASFPPSLISFSCTIPFVPHLSIFSISPSTHHFRLSFPSSLLLISF